MKRRIALGLVMACAALIAGAPARADDSLRIRAAREATVELDVSRAHALLDGSASSTDAATLIERARLAIYEGSYDAAVEILTRPELSHAEEAAELLGIALGCARATAAAITMHDEERGVFIRLQDESDRPLAPFLVEVAVAVRDMLARDLKVELPRPLRIELVRDLFTLAAMTGLPESAAQNTGTVAVAKWGRVTMVSPRAVPRGYPWADTLAHEMAHLAQTRASGDRAPLWLQEGVAKREETRWRDPRHFDDFPGADVIAGIGLDKGLGRPIDKLGASIALLPTAEQAMVAFAEVTSFVRFWVRSTDESALPELLVRLRSAEGADFVDQAMKGVTGTSLSEWSTRWLTYLGTVKRQLPPGTSFDGEIPHEQELRRAAALSELLARRGRFKAVHKVLVPAQKLAPFDPLLRHRLATALFALGEKTEADKLIASMEDAHSEFGPLLALHGRQLAEGGQTEKAAIAFRAGLELSPLDPEVACEEKPPPEIPATPAKAPLCEAARAMLQD